MKAMVIGGAGFIGSWVVDKLIEEGYDVSVIDNLSTGSKSNINPKARFYEKDTRENLSEIFLKEKPDYVFLLASQINVRTSLKDPSGDAEINILGSLNVINECIKNGTKKIIFSSSGGAIYGDTKNIPSDENEATLPESPYGIAKLTIEHYLRIFKNIFALDYVALRYSNVYGPRQNSKGEAGVIALFADKILNNKTCTIFGEGNQTRDYVYVKDVTNANILAAENLSGVYNVGTGREIDVNEVFEKTKEGLGKGEVVHSNKIEGELMRSALDNRKLKAQGWKPEYDFESGLKETIEYFKNLDKQ